ncbi:MAG: hypothetical protein ACP5OO_07970 [Chloroflexia bacterium]
MRPGRRRPWLTALGLFLAGGLAAYLLARRGRRKRPADTPVAELSARLRKEAAARARRLRRRKKPAEEVSSPGGQETA